MKELEIKMPVINGSTLEIRDGHLCYVEKKELHVFLFGKFRKWRWFYRFLLKRPVEIGIVKGIDTSKFKDGDKLYLDINKPGHLTSKT